MEDLRINQGEPLSESGGPETPEYARGNLRRAISKGESVLSISTGHAMSFRAVQTHVGVLERVALVTKVRHSRERIVHANGPTLRRAVTLLDAYQRRVQRADEIEEFLAKADEPRGATRPSSARTKTRRA